jgi:hypothetical protein
MHTPEKLSLWDRWFNRHRREVHQRGAETWQATTTYHGVRVGEPREYKRQWIEYRKIDRLTGSETIEREYLN